MTTPHEPDDSGGQPYPPGTFSPAVAAVPPVPPVGVGIPDSPGSGGKDSSGSVTDTARDQAQRVKNGAADATSQVTQTQLLDEVRDRLDAGQGLPRALRRKSRTAACRRQR